MINMLTICNAFATLTQCLKNSQFFKNDQKNKTYNDRNFLNKSDFNSRKKIDNRIKNAKKCTKQQNRLNNRNHCSDIICLF